MKGSDDIWEMLLKQQLLPSTLYTLHIYRLSSQRNLCRQPCMISESKLLHWPFIARFCKGASYKWLSCNMWCHQMLCKKKYLAELRYGNGKHFG
ncbi:hypothetical protein Prudu_005422 [Prunus dulcis]|uniref:Uncharacterized protein n=1 Tax=Prunus dulcis TaxID=3755 RepID=A0A4Y1QXN3_PRUDU|nr:hypothetical protein Prudu_005422 [Prunus dulcis]